MGLRTHIYVSIWVSSNRGARHAGTQQRARACRLCSQAIRPGESRGRLRSALGRPSAAVLAADTLYRGSPVMPLKCDHPVASIKAVGKLPWYYQCLVMGLVRRAAMHDDLNFYWTMRFAPRAWAHFFIEFRTRGDRSPRYVFIGELIEDPEGVWEPPVVAPAVAPPAPLAAPPRRRARRWLGRFWVSSRPPSPRSRRLPCRW